MTITAPDPALTLAAVDTIELPLRVELPPGRLAGSLTSGPLAPMLDAKALDAMVKLDKGKYTETPVHTRFGYHVIQLDDVRQLKFPPLAEVKPRIQQQLVQNRVEELVKGLRAKAKVE